MNQTFNLYYHLSLCLYCFVQYVIILLFHHFCMSLYNPIIRPKLMQVPLSISMFLLIIRLVDCYEFASLTVNADSKIINTLTTYQFDFDRTQDNSFNPVNDYQNIIINSTDTISITFPSSYTLTSISCIISIDAGAQFAPTCAASANQVTVRNFIVTPVIISKVSLWVSNILNPSPAILTAYFTGSIGNDNSGPGYYASSVQLEPSTFTSCYATFSPSTVNTTADMVFTLTPTNQILANGSLKIKFPSTRRWANDISSSNFFPISPVMSCSNKSANVLSSLQCTGDNILTQVSFTNIFATPVISAFMFSINSFLSPPTNQQSDLLVATSYSSEGYKIDTCNFYVSDLTPKALTSITISSSSGSSMVVNQYYTIRFTVVLSDTLSQSDTFTIVFPTGSILNFNSGTVSSNVSTSGISSNYEPATLTLYLSFLNPQYTFARNTIINFNVGTYRAPPSAQPTSSFLFTVYRNNYKKLEGTSSFSAIPSVVTGTISHRVSTTINANTTYTFQVSLSDSLSSAGKIKLTIPAAIVILATSSSCAVLSGVNTSLSPICSYNSSQNSIILSGLNSSSSAIDPQTLTISIAGLRNPSSTSPTASFGIRTYHKATDSSIVAIGTMPGITSTAALIDGSLVAIIASSTVVNDVGVTYSLTYKVSNAIPAGGYLTMFMPAQIGVDSTTVPNSCSVNLGATSYVQTPCSATNSVGGTVINFTNPFSSDAAVNTVIAVRISGAFRNPYSTRPTSTFKLHTYNSNGYEIAYLDNALTIQMLTPANFNAISVSRSSLRNYDLTSYTFTLSQPSPLEPASVIIITFPTNVVPTTSSLCSLAAPTSATLSCVYSSPQIKITLPLTALGSGTSVAIVVSNVRNPASFEPSGPFTLQSKTSNQLYSYSLQVHSPLLMNAIPSDFQSLTFIFTPAVYSEPSSLQLNFNPTDSTKLPARLRLTLANSLNIGSLSCNSFIDFVGSCITVSTNTIEVTGNFTNAPMGFSVTGFTTPASSATDYTTLVTHDSNGYKLDESANTIIFAPSCTMPCKTCTSPALPASCTSCYRQTTITSKIYFDSDLSKCLDACPDGKYANTATNLCASCDANCLSCQSSPTLCLSCNQSSVYKYLYIDTAVSPNTQSCLSACPLRMFSDSTRNSVCTGCLSPCVTCFTATACLSCIAGRFLFASQCRTSCPAGSFVENPTTNACDPCGSSCLTCINTTTTCTSCLSPLLIYQSQCRSTCPLPLVPQNGTCGPCDSSCLTCVEDPFNCSSCNTSSPLAYLLNWRCLSACPETYYRNIGLGACSPCSSVVGLNCNNCSTVSTCLSCNSGYVLLNASCLNYVPVGYVNMSGVAVPCTGDCASCSNSSSNCTSCLQYNLLNNICYQTCPSGYAGINRTCLPCVSPCHTCQGTVTTCTSCLPTLAPPLYLSNSRCVPTCPDGTFASSANYSCLPCTPPCQFCSSAAQCLTCLNGFYLHLQTCTTTCPSGYAAVNRLCQLCQGNCATCQAETTFCTSCITNTYLYSLNSSCLTSCGNGLFVDASTQSCVYCTPPCKTCASTATTCLSCLTGALYNYRCLANCPAQHFSQSGVCQQCPSQCAACSSLNNCSSCNSGSVLYNNYCVTSCPSTHAVVLSQTCTLCSGASCHECTSADVCTTCDNTYSLLNGACLGECPASFKSNGTHCLDINQEVLTTPNSFPVPFSIAGAVLLIACLMSKLQFSNTFLPGAIFSFFGILQCGALGYFLYLYYNSSFSADPLPFFIGAASIAFMYLLNFLSFFIQNIIFCNDKQFYLWSSHGPNKCSIFWVNLISMMICHKFRNILFCKLFTFAVFSAQLESVSKFKVLNVFSFLSLLHSGGAIFAVSVAVGTATKQSQLFYECIDVIVLTSLNVIFAFFNVVKSKDFFYELTPEGFELKRKIKVEDDYYSSKQGPLGKEAEDEEGFYSNVYHVQGASSKQGLNTGLMTGTANKYKLYNASSFKDQSFGSLAEQEQLKYQNISVQAVQRIDDTFSDPNSFDITVIPGHDKEGNSNFTTIFNKSDKGVGVSLDKGSQIGIQNTIDHGPSLKSQAIGGSYAPSVHDVSIQPTLKKVVDQSMQPRDQLEPVDKSVQRTVFFREDQSVQYGSSMKSKPPSLKDKSISNYNYKPSIRDQSVQEARSQADKSLMYQPSLRDQANQKTIERVDQSVQNRVSEQNEQVQAVPQVSDKGDQKEVSAREQSAQFQPSIRNRSVQHQNAIQFDEYNEDIYPTKTSEDKVIFEEMAPEQHQAENQLRAEETDQFMLPKQEIRTYQEQLEQRIREKEKQLNQIKRKVEAEERRSKSRNIRMNKQAMYYDQTAISLGRQEQSSAHDNSNADSNQDDSTGRMNRNFLKKQAKQIEQEPDAEIDRTIEQIDVLADETTNAQPHKLNDNNGAEQSKGTEEQFLGMLEDHPSKVIFQNESEQGSVYPAQVFVRSPHDANPLKGSGLMIRPQRKAASFEESSAELSSGKDGSTNIYSSFRPALSKKLSSKRNGGGIEDSQHNINGRIGSKSPHIGQPSSLSDMSYTIEQISPQLNETSSTTYIKKESANTRMKEIAYGRHQKLRKQLPRQQPNDDGAIKRFQLPSRASIGQGNQDRMGRRSSLVFAGRSQFTQQGLARKQLGGISPLKVAKKWQFQSENKDVEQSGDEEVANTRATHAQLVSPMETDKEVFGFKTSRVMGPETRKIEPNERLGQRQQNNTLIDQISPFIGETTSRFPSKPNIWQREPQLQFGAEEFEAEPYIEEEPSGQASTHINNLIIAQMLDRPANNYESRHSQKRRRSKQKSSSALQRPTETQKIYQQRLAQNKKRW